MAAMKKAASGPDHTDKVSMEASVISLLMLIFSYKSRYHGRRGETRNMFVTENDYNSRCSFGKEEEKCIVL